MQYLCLIYWNEQELDAIKSPEIDRLNEAHLDFNDGLRAQGKLVLAEALGGSATARQVRVRNGRTTVTDGPFTETKEMVAGFYLLEARDLDEAVAIAARMPSAPRAVIEVREIRKLVVGDRTS